MAGGLEGGLMKASEKYQLSVCDMECCHYSETSIIEVKDHEDF